MKFLPSAIIFGTASCVLTGCFKRTDSSLDRREDYVVCLSSADSISSFKGYFESFARDKGMDILDRSKQAEEELRSLADAATVLAKTDTPFLLITIEKRENLRISVTNAGLMGRVALTLKYKENTIPRDAMLLLTAIRNKYKVAMLSGSTGKADDPCS